MAQRAHYFHRTGQQPRRHDLRHGVASGGERIIRGEDGAVKLRFGGQQAQGNLQRHAKETLGADKKAGQVGAGIFQAGAAKLDDFAVGQHRLDAGARGWRSCRTSDSVRRRS